MYSLHDIYSMYMWLIPNSPDTSHLQDPRDRGYPKERPLSDSKYTKAVACLICYQALLQKTILHYLACGL